MILLNGLVVMKRENIDTEAACSEWKQMSKMSCGLMEDVVMRGGAREGRMGKGGSRIFMRAVSLNDGWQRTVHPASAASLVWMAGCRAEMGGCFPSRVRGYESPPKSQSIPPSSG